jgi:hypothetical protein
MKLANFVTHKGLRSLIDTVVLKSNYALAETYMFSNFHITRLLKDNLALPQLDQKFFYQCLSVVTIMNTRAKTVPAVMLESAAQFNMLRPYGVEKVDATDLMDLMPDLAKTMATMAANHLWENLTSRVKAYLKWKHPGLKTYWDTIAMFVADFPSCPVVKIDKLKLSNKKGKRLSAATVAKRVAATAVLTELRRMCPLKSGNHYASSAHKLLPFYANLHREVEQHLAERRLLQARGVPLKKTKARRFTLLPEKSGFTVSYIPICERFMVSLVSKLKHDGRPVEKFTGGRGTALECEAMWEKYCNLNAVETKTRSFHRRFLTDGCGSSVLTDSRQALVQSNTNEPWNPKLLNGKKKVGYSGTDPGITDVATVAHFKVVDGTNQPTETSSYSSSRYYEAAKIKLSARRTARWNEETSDEHIMLSRDMDTSTMEGQEALVTDYLDVVRGLIDHRFNKGYRNMRFLRYVFKQKAVNEICDMIAPPDQFTVVGFGDWSGPGGTCIKRRYCGPLQDIKRELKRRTDSVAFRTVWEYLTSMTCHLTWKRLTNMVAASTTRNRNGDLVSKGPSKVHKVLHCKTSARGNSPKNTTWNRDVNASRNILMLLMLEIRGFNRPAEFQPLPKRRARTKASDGLAAPVASQSLSLGASIFKPDGGNIAQGLRRDVMRSKRPVLK